VFGPKATTACPKRGYKELSDNSREAVLALADGWLATAGAVDEEGGEADEQGEGGFTSDFPSDSVGESACEAAGKPDSVQAAMALMDSLSFR
jgi:hypothetical protein